jgi:hypothetical protein
MYSDKNQQTQSSKMSPSELQSKSLYPSLLFSAKSFQMQFVGEKVAPVPLMIYRSGDSAWDFPCSFLMAKYTKFTLSQCLLALCISEPSFRRVLLLCNVILLENMRQSLVILISWIHPSGVDLEKVNPDSSVWIPSIIVGRFSCHIWVDLNDFRLNSVFHVREYEEKVVNAFTRNTEKLHFVKMNNIQCRFF